MLKESAGKKFLRGLVVRIVGVLLTYLLVTLIFDHTINGNITRKEASENIGTTDYCSGFNGKIYINGEKYKVPIMTNKMVENMLEIAGTPKDASNGDGLIPANYYISGDLYFLNNEEEGHNLGLKNKCDNVVFYNKTDNAIAVSDSMIGACYYLDESEWSIGSLTGGEYVSYSVEDIITQFSVPYETEKGTDTLSYLYKYENCYLEFCFTCAPDEDGYVNGGKMEGDTYIFSSEEYFKDQDPVPYTLDYMNYYDKDFYEHKVRNE